MVTRIVEGTVKQRLMLTIAVLLCTAACGAETLTNSTPTTTTATTTIATSTTPTTTNPERRLTGGLAKPPPLGIRNGAMTVDVEATSFCWGNGCADGLRPSRPPDVGSGDSLIVAFPEKGWSFVASFQAAGDQCARTTSVNMTSTGPTTHLLTPALRAGTYDISFFGKGPTASGNGDVIAWVRFTTTADGPLPQPQARLGLLALHDRVVDSYGVELSISNLAATPAVSSATITATSAEGRSIAFEATPANAPCVVGTVLFRGPNDKGKEAAALGRAPFAIEVQLFLEGVRYVARANWPDDEDPDEAPYVPLRFVPPLPAPA